jgi:hypothetical protein
LAKLLAATKAPKRPGAPPASFINAARPVHRRPFLAAVDPDRRAVDEARALRGEPDDEPRALRTRVCIANDARRLKVAESGQDSDWSAAALALWPCGPCVDKQEEAVPALSERDLIKILGPDYREKQEAAIRASGVRDEERIAVNKIKQLDGSKFATIYLAIIGLVLIVASTYSVTGLTLEIQDACGIAMVVVGLGVFIYITRRLKQLRGMVSSSAAKAA